MQVYIGIDWSENKHDVAFMNEAGARVVHLTIPATADGLMQMDTTRQQIGVSTQESLVALETAHTLMIDFLWSRGYSQVYVVPPSVVKSTRGRYRHSGARNDESDAYLLADLLRTDRARLSPWYPDSLLTRQIRARTSLLRHLTKHIVSCSNRLRSVLLRYYPGAVVVFSSLRTQIGLQFVCTYPTPQTAKQLSWADFQAFAADYGYTQPKRLPSCFARLQAAHPEALPETVTVFQEEAVTLAKLLLELVCAKTKQRRTLSTLFQQHPDAPLFASLPGAGDILAPALLAKFGDDRQRFPKPAAVQSLAGTCPVTKESGKRKVVCFRHACDHEFRDIAQKWALASLRQSPWAQTYWRSIRSRCHSSSHATRCLANRWLAIAWKLWHSHQLYDEDYHLRQRALHSKPRHL